MSYDVFDIHSRHVYNRKRNCGSPFIFLSHKNLRPEVILESYTAIIIIAALLVLTAAIMIIRENKESRNRFIERTEKNWGKLPKIKQTAEESESITHYFRDRILEQKSFYVDDITWNDCDMDRIFRQMNSALSSPGEDVLYYWLRTPVAEPGLLAEREKIISYYSSHTDRRRNILRILNEIGRMKKMSVYDHLRRLREAEKIGSGKYIALCILMVIGLVMLFIHPVAALAVLIPVAAMNIYVYLRQKDRLGIFVRSFSCVLRLTEAAGKLASCNDEIINTYADELKDLRRKLNSFGRGAFLVTSSGNTGTGMGAALLEYLKILFHLDLIKFDQMIDAYRGNEDACMRIFEIAGELDAAIAVASYREYLGTWCRPELVEDDHGFTEAQDLYHPLLKAPVPVTFSIRGGNLITGSNASGKSTFLKSTAIASILAQSVNTVPAMSFRASRYRIYTSMALRDDIGSGESYFIVEIKSLKRILDAAEEEGLPVLGIVDEVLRGTNTIERISASAQILKRLAGKKAVILAATHDIELSYILEEIYTNYHFTEKIEGSDVVFDYMLHSGRAVSRNAITLLEVCGYGSDLAGAAREQAVRFEETGEWKL